MYIWSTTSPHITTYQWALHHLQLFGCLLQQPIFLRALINWVFFSLTCQTFKFYTRVVHKVAVHSSGMLIFDWMVDVYWSRFGWFFCWHWSSCSLQLLSFWLGAGHLLIQIRYISLLALIRMLSVIGELDCWRFLHLADCLELHQRLLYSLSVMFQSAVLHHADDFGSSSCGSTLDMVSPPWCWNNLKYNTMKSGKFTPSCLITPACFYLIQMIPNKAAIQVIIMW